MASVQSFARGVSVVALLVVAAPDAASAEPARRPSRARVADADPVRTKRAVVVRKSASNKAAAVGRLPAHAAVVIEHDDGAWLRIRAKAKVRRATKEVVGYVARDAVTFPAAGTATMAPGDEASEVDTPIAKETRTTIEKVVVRAKPGEKQAAVATLPAGTEVTLEAERGRWYRIRAGKVVGYLARTTISEPVAPAVSPPVETTTTTTAVAETDTEHGETPIASGTSWSAARRPDQRDGASALLQAQAIASSALRSDPKLDAAVVAEVAKGAQLSILDATQAGGWVRARDATGSEGWIQADHLGNGSAAVAITEPVTPRERGMAATASSAETGDGGSSALRVHAGLGYRVLGMDFSSSGGQGLTNYLVTADAGALDLDVDVIALRLGRMMVGIDGNVEASRSSPGIEYAGPSRPGGKIPFSTFDVDVGLRAGFRIRRLFELAARAGVHYDAFVAQDVDNVALLPRERLLGPTVGLRAEIVPAGSRFNATLRVDMLVAGGRKQTPGLEDGELDSARATWAGMTVRVQLARHFSVSAGYDFGRMSTRWSGMSVRIPGVTNAQRVDSSQLVQVGLGVDM